MRGIALVEESVSLSSASRSRLAVGWVELCLVAHFAHGVETERVMMRLECRIALTDMGMKEE